MAEYYFHHSIKPLQCLNQSPPRKSQNWYFLTILSLILIFFSCQKQELYKASESGNTHGLNGKDVFSTIDTLQQIGFFIKNRPNPDAPLMGANATNTGIQLLNTGGEMEYTDETYMVLGGQLNNPYSIPNMTAAYNAFFNTQYTTVSVTHKYVRFAPANEAHIAMLDDSLELDLFTHPLDYEMLQDGDLYVAPGHTIEEIPYLYTVVPASYNLPSTIPYTVLADLHLPIGEAALYIEELAESMALGANYSSFTTPQEGPTLTTITRNDITFSNGDHPMWSHTFADCYYEPDNPDPICPENPPPPPPPPPPPAVCGLPGLTCLQSGYPRGRIRVWDTQLNQCVPVQDVQVRSRRWFKIKNDQTDNQGQFYIDTKYNNNTRIRVIFRNGELSVKPLRNKIGIRLSLLPIRARLGTFNGCSLNTIDHIFYRTDAGAANEPFFGTGNGANRFTNTFMHWLAATAINSRKYQIAQGNIDNVKPLLGRASGGHRFQLYLATGGTPSARGTYLETPMLAYINKGFTWDDVYDIGKLVLYAAKTYMSSGHAVPVYATTAVQSLLTLVFQGSLCDAIFYYNTPNLNLSSSDVSQKFYEAFTIAGLLKERANKTDWKAYLKKNNKILSGILAGYSFHEVSKELPLLSILEKFEDDWFSATKSLASIAASTFSLYQLITTFLDASDKELFDMYNGFSEAYSHFLTDRKYGVLSDDILDQNYFEIKSTASLSSNIIYIETWRSNNVADKISTIPMTGIFYDLYDTQNDFVNPPSNNLETVQNISWENIAKTGLGTSGFNTSPDLFSHWRTNLTNTNGSQSTQITNLFNWYISP